MKDARIFYLAKPFGVPLGGIATIFRHVEILVNEGFDASICLLPGEGDIFVRHNAPIVDARNFLDARPTDIFVLPEAWVCHLPEVLSLPVRKYVFCQNHFYAFSGLTMGSDYRSFDIEQVFASSLVIASFLEREFKIARVPVVPYAIDRTLFRPLPKLRQIAFMPRKLSLEASFIQGLFVRRYPNYSDIPWVAIDAQPIEEVARRLGQSQWFLSLSHMEGFGLPPLEAMSAEAIVAGFHGEGGKEYATQKNGFWCDTGDLHGCVRSLADAISLCDSGLSAGMLAAGRRTAEIYDSSVQAAALIDFWQSNIERRA